MEALLGAWVILSLIPLIICIYLLVGFGRIWLYAKERNEILTKILWRRMYSKERNEILTQILQRLEKIEKNTDREN